MAQPFSCIGGITKLCTASPVSLQLLAFSLLYIYQEVDAVVGRCGIGYRECPDGTCVRDALAVGCNTCTSGEKKCSDGTCILLLKKCVEPLCPVDIPNQCPGTTQCYKNDAHCDGSDDCPDGFDEANCPQSSTSPFNNAWYAASIVPGLLLILACFYVITKSKTSTQDFSGGLLRLRAFPTGHTTTVTTEIDGTRLSRPLGSNGHIPVSNQGSSIGNQSLDPRLKVGDNASSIGLFRSSYHDGDQLSTSMVMAGAGSSCTGSTLSCEKPLEPSAPPLDDGLVTSTGSAGGGVSLMEHHKPLAVTLSNGGTVNSEALTTPAALPSSTRLLHCHNDDDSISSSCTQTCYGGTANSCTGIVSPDQSPNHSGDYEVIDFSGCNGNPATVTVNGNPTVNNGNNTTTSVATTGNIYSDPSTNSEQQNGSSVGPPPTYEEALSHHRRDSAPTYNGTSLLRGQISSEVHLYEQQHSAAKKSEPRHLQFLPSCKHKTRLKRHLMDDLTSDSDFMSSSSSDEQSDDEY